MSRSLRTLGIINQIGSLFFVVVGDSFGIDSGIVDPQIITAECFMAASTPRTAVSFLLTLSIHRTISDRGLMLLRLADRREVSTTRQPRFQQRLCDAPGRIPLEARDDVHGFARWSPRISFPVERVLLR